MRKFRLLALIASLCVAAAAGAQVEEAYRLGPRDSVRITVYEQPDLSSVARIAENGTVGLPLVGEMVLSGLTAREAEARIEAVLQERDIVRQPQVSVMVESYQSRRVSVLGDVVRAGMYSISRDSTVLDLLAEAGGLAASAADVAIVTNARDAQRRRIVNIAELLQGGAGPEAEVLIDGDRIFVPPMDKFYVYGQVNKPGVYRLERGMTVVQALSLAGGLTERGTERGLSIRRSAGDDGAVAAIEAELTDPVKPSDVIQVKESLF